MAFRLNFRRAVSELIKTHAERRRKASQEKRRTRFFEKLEDRFVLNGIPIAKEDLRYSTAVDTALVVSTNPLLANDWDPEGSSLTASVVTNPANGSISSFSGSAGTFTYTPNSSYTGVDTFTYKVNDGTADSDTVTVAIAVGGCRPSQESCRLGTRNKQSKHLLQIGGQAAGGVGYVFAVSQR